MVSAAMPFLFSVKEVVIGLTPTWRSLAAVVDCWSSAIQSVKARSWIEVVSFASIASAMGLHMEMVNSVSSSRAAQGREFKRAREESRIYRDGADGGSTILLAG